MENKKLSDLIKEFIEEQNKDDFDEYYDSEYGIAEMVMDKFEEFPKRKLL